MCLYSNSEMGEMGIVSKEQDKLTHSFTMLDTLGFLQNSQLNLLPQVIKQKECTAIFDQNANKTATPI